MSPLQVATPEALNHSLEDMNSQKNTEMQKVYSRVADYTSGENKSDIRNEKSVILALQNRIREKKIQELKLDSRLKYLTNTDKRMQKNIDKARAYVQKTKSIHQDKI